MFIIGIDDSKNKLDCSLIDDSNQVKFKFKIVFNSEGGFIAASGFNFAQELLR